jgi:hypothetical protein
MTPAEELREERLAIMIYDGGLSEAEAVELIEKELQECR